MFNPPSTNPKAAKTFPISQVFWTSEPNQGHAETFSLQQLQRCSVLPGFFLATLLPLKTNSLSRLSQDPHTESDGDTTTMRASKSLFCSTFSHLDRANTCLNGFLSSTQLPRLLSMAFQHRLAHHLHPPAHPSSCPSRSLCSRSFLSKPSTCHCSFSQLFSTLHRL